MIAAEEKKTQIILNKDQKEAVDEVSNFIETLSDDEIKNFKVFIQGAKFTYSLNQYAKGR